MLENVKMNVDLSKIDSKFKGYYVAAFTDQYTVGNWPETNNFDCSKLLELRVFNDQTEYKWFRGNIGEDFSYRKLSDEDITFENYEDPIEECQLLDINIKRSNSDLPEEVRMSKGGAFYFPDYGKLTPNTKAYIKVKYYVPGYKEDDITTVHAYVKDWRLAGFEIDEEVR